MLMVYKPGTVVEVISELNWLCGSTGIIVPPSRLAASHIQKMMKVSLLLPVDFGEVKTGWGGTFFIEGKDVIRRSTHDLMKSIERPTGCWIAQRELKVLGIDEALVEKFARR